MFHISEDFKYRLINSISLFFLVLLLPGSTDPLDSFLYKSSLGELQQSVIYPLDPEHIDTAYTGEVEDEAKKALDSKDTISTSSSKNLLDDNGLFLQDELASNFIDQIQIRVANDNIENNTIQSSNASFELTEAKGIELSSEYNIIGEFEIEGSRTIEQEVILKNENNEPVSTDLELVYDLSELKKIVYDGNEYSIENPPEIKPYTTQEDREVCLYDDDPSESNLRVLSGLDCLAGSYSITSQVTKGASVSLFDKDSNELRIDFSQNENVDAYFQNSTLILNIRDLQIPNNTYETAVSVVYTMDEVYGNYNLRIDGAEASDALAFPQLEFADIDGNGKPDLLVSGYWVSPSNGSSTYILSDAILAEKIGKGAVIDLSDSNNYSLRIDGTYYIRPLDMDNDGVDEFVFNDYAADTLTRTNNGTIVVYQPGFVDLSTPGQTANVATLTTTYPNYYAIIHGARNGDNLGYGNGQYRSIMLDYDGDGLLDYTVVSPFADDDGSNTGSVYIFNGLLLKNLTPGQSFDLLNEDYSVRIAGELDNQPNTGISSIRKIDADGDSEDELIVTQNTAYFNGIYRAGIVYYVDDVVLNSAKNISLKDTNNYAFRIGGEGTNGFANANILDQPDSNLPLVVTSNQPSPKRFYVSMDTLTYLKGQAQKEYDIAVDTGWYDATFINYDCVRESSKGDYFNDNNNYEVFNVCWAGNNGANTGSSYLVNENFMGQNFSGTDIDLSNILNDQGIVRWDGDNEGGTYFGQNTFTPQDINNDSKNDFVFQNDWTDYHGARSGSAYIILNYPHTIDLGSKTIFNTSSPELTGTVNADRSVTDISMVEYSVDNSSFNADWKQCSPSDGGYNSNTEAFKCILDSIPDGNHTVYFRSYDAMGSYTAQNHYAKKDITVDTTPPNPVITKIGQIGNIPVLDSLYYYYTANSVTISGTSEAGSVVTFTFGGQSYTATADSNGNFMVQIPYLPDGTDILKYSAVDKAGNVSKTKSLTLIIPCYNFPEELQNIYCPSTEDTDQSEDIEEAEPVLIEILEGELPETGNETSQILVKIIDEDGNILSGIEVIIGGQSYITDEQGYIYLDVDYGDYEVKINYGGEQLSYNLEINSNEETVQVILDEATGNNLYYVCCCVILIAVLLFFFILFWKRRKEEEEEQAEKSQLKK